MSNGPDSNDFPYWDYLEVKDRSVFLAGTQFHVSTPLMTDYHLSKHPEVVLPRELVIQITRAYHADYHRLAQPVFLAHGPTTIFRFGKYEGKSLSEVAAIDGQYIDWCVLNIPRFCIRGAIDMTFLSKQAQVVNHLKCESDEWNHLADEYSDAARDEEKLWRNANLDALDGRPEAYWNLDFQ